MYPRQQHGNAFSGFSVLIIAFALAFSMFNISRWKTLSVIQHDVTQYYAYLPAAFIFKNLKLTYVPKLPPELGPRTWTLHLEDGSRVLKMPMGLAVLYAPFFFIAHTQAQLQGENSSGYTATYEFWLCVSSVFYVVLAFLLLRRLLLRYFDDVVVALTMLSVLFATNLYFYTTTEAAMSHAYSFFLFTLFITISISWSDTPNYLNSFFLGIAGGLITLVRPTNIVVFILPMLHGIRNIDDIKSRMAHTKQIAVILLTFLLAISPQLAYWKYATGNWLHYSYHDEGFFFAQSHFLDGLFSYRKGWLVYTPIMSLALLGFFFLKNELKTFRIPLVVFTIVNMHIVFSWWCWWYGGSYGMRSLIESYAFLSIPLAAFYHAVWSKSAWMKSLLFLAILFFTTINCIQTWQYRKSIIHWDSMTKEAYWGVFLKLRLPSNYSELIKSPDYRNAKQGKREYRQ